MARAKVAPYSVDEIEAFHKRVIDQSKTNYSITLDKSVDSNLLSVVPTRTFDQIELWFHADTVLQLAAILKAINEESDERFLTLGRACFSSILRVCSSQDKHWGYICDNVRPTNLIQKNAIKYFSKALSQFVLNYKHFQDLSLAQRKYHHVNVPTGAIEIREGNAITELGTLPLNSVDLIVTSPPYLNVTDYFDSQRLSLLWLFPDIEPERRNLEIGARYRRSRKDSHTPYIIDLEKCIIEMARVLKANSHCCLVLGESTSYRPYINDVVYLMEQYGFSIVAQLDRRIAKKRSLSPRIMGETIIVACKGAQ